MKWRMAWDDKDFDWPPDCRDQRPEMAPPHTDWQDREEVVDNWVTIMNTMYPEVLHWKESNDEMPCRDLRREL